MLSVIIFRLLVGCLPLLPSVLSSLFSFDLFTNIISHLRMKKTKKWLCTNTIICRPAIEFTIQNMNMNASKPDLSLYPSNDATEKI